MTNNMFDMNFKEVKAHLGMSASAKLPKKQMEWLKMSPEQRANARSKYPDSDGDGVPDIFDCQPKNAMRQDFASDMRKGNGF